MSEKFIFGIYMYECEKCGFIIERDKLNEEDLPKDCPTYEKMTTWRRLTEEEVNLIYKDRKNRLVARNKLRFNRRYVKKEV